MSDILSDLRILYEREGDMAHLRAADEIERNREAIAELVEALRPFADIRFSEEDCLRASDVIAKYDTTTKETK